MKKLDPNCIYIMQADIGVHAFHTNAKGDLAIAMWIDWDGGSDTFFHNGKIRHVHNHWYEDSGMSKAKKLRSGVLTVHAFKMTREDIVNLWLES